MSVKKGINKRNNEKQGTQELIEQWSNGLDAGKIPSEWHGDYAPAYAKRIPMQPRETLSIKVSADLKLTKKEAERKNITSSEFINESLLNEMINATH